MSKQSLLDSPTNTLKVISLENNTKRGKWAREILKERAEDEKASKKTSTTKTPRKRTTKKSLAKTVETNNTDSQEG